MYQLAVAAATLPMLGLFLGVDGRTLASVLGIVVLVTTIRVCSRDPYGLFHLNLNYRPGENTDVPPDTEWLNMGYWKNTSVFRDACKGLAMKMVRAAAIPPNAAILDVGHGTGQSLILLLSEPTIPRPSSLTGITSLPAHQQRSEERIARLRANRKELSDIQIRFYAGDAVCSQVNVDHPLHPSSPKIFDVIMALDCAMHFNTRKVFLSQSFQKLAPEGRIALADICIAQDELKKDRIAHFMMSFLRMIPKQNMISREDYKRDMLAIGYVDVTVEDITDHVFPGFVRFLGSRGWLWPVFASMFGRLRRAGGRYVIASGSKPAAPQ
ncbi:S-adenosyl-L-methionine-dependent methyltransferase [Crucibulum laeve]|uniref:S-adenosyl-L-methionine-dependent methyltransferase n=1 Tax=Crucibulum laeve TaxID=68775 RepID=A0A5C3M718_9AGAR|nr:S-adenosyl-L-methionine-dependent methyltransferase [Crucibulum laeve]